MSGERS
ncbi:6ce32ef1-3546-4be8-a9ff-f93ec2147463 [Thermothielavioides terrestris]|nr:6ce32ef1-3546-4be8-a9ff-f93ec2147463 [Thermothielavioides terrestris]